MPPLNLDLLIAGDDAEWNKAWNDHGFYSYARRIVEAVLSNYRRKGEADPFSEDVAQDAFIKLFKRVKSGAVNNVIGLKPLLRVIATGEAIDLLRKQWFNKQKPESANKEDPNSDWTPDDLEEFLRSLKRQVGIEVDRPLEEVIEEWAKAAELDLLEKALFREHLVHRCTLEDFGQAHEMHLASVFRLKSEVLRKLRRFFRDEL